MSKNKFRNKIKITKIQFLSSLAFVSFALGVYGFYFGYSFHGKFNELGDYVGGVVGSLWTLTGSILVYMAFVSQQKQIDEGKVELKRQQFENIFFRLIETHHSILNSIDIGIGENKKTGSDAFESLFKDLRDDIESFDIENSEQFIEDFKKFYKRNNKDLSHYFSNILNLLRITKEAEAIEILEKELYYDILLSQLSSSERILLTYYIFYLKYTDEESRLYSKYHLKEVLKEFDLTQEIDRTMYISEVVPNLA